MHPDLTKYYLGKEEPVKSCLQALRDEVLSFDSKISETQKYGMPCYLLANKPFCYIWTDKKTNHPYLLLVKGNLIDHPLLIQGGRKKMKIVPIDPMLDLPVEELIEILTKARSFYD